MTREEAIADIKNNIKPIVGGKSLDMAIEALTYSTLICGLTDGHICHFPWLNCVECEVQHKKLGLVKIDKVLEIIEQMKSENSENNEEPIRTIFENEYDDFRDRVLALKEEKE